MGLYLAIIVDQSRTQYYSLSPKSRKTSGTQSREGYPYWTWKNCWKQLSQVRLVKTSSLKAPWQTEQVASHVQSTRVNLLKVLQPRGQVALQEALQVTTILPEEKRVRFTGSSGQPGLGLIDDKSRSRYSLCISNSVRMNLVACAKADTRSHCPCLSSFVLYIIQIPSACLGELCF